MQIKACGVQAEDTERTILKFRKKVVDLNEEIQEHKDQVYKFIRIYKFIIFLSQINRKFFEILKDFKLILHDHLPSIFRFYVWKNRRNELMTILMDCKLQTFLRRLALLLKFEFFLKKKLIRNIR